MFFFFFFHLKRQQKNLTTMSAAEVAHILKKKEAILSLEKYLDRKICISVGNREIRGTLKGFDNNVSLVLADSKQWKNNTVIRSIGACVIRGGDITSIYSGDIKILDRNPFL